MLFNISFLFCFCLGIILGQIIYYNKEEIKWFFTPRRKKFKILKKQIEENYEIERDKAFMFLHEPCMNSNGKITSLWNDGIKEYGKFKFYNKKLNRKII